MTEKAEKTKKTEEAKKSGSAKKTEARPAIDIERDDGRDAGRYVIRLDGHEAELTYSKTADGRLIIDHTGVPDALGGRGLGGQLVARAVEDARAEHRRVVPACSFAEAYIDRHPALHDVLHK